MSARYRVLVFLVALTPFSVIAEATIASGDYEPILLRKGDDIMAGVGVDVTVYLFPDTTTRPRLIAVPVRRLTLAANVGEFDWSYLPCHVNFPLYHKSSAILTVSAGIVVTENSAIKSVNDLAQRTVGVWTINSIPVPGIDDNPQVTKRTFNTADSALRMVQRGRIDAVTLSELALQYQIKTNADLKSENFRFIKIYDISMCVFGRKILGAGELQQVEQRIALGRDNKVFEKILDHYR